MQPTHHFKVDVLPLDLWQQLCKKINETDLKCLACVSKKFQHLIYAIQAVEGRRRDYFYLTYEFDSSLIRAIKLCQSQIVKYLLKKNDPFIDPNEKASLPLRTAIENEDIETVKVLVADKRTELNVALIKAAKKNSVSMLKVLLGSRCFLDSGYKHQGVHDALVEAAYHQNYESASELLQYYVPGYYGGNSPLSVAVKNGDYKLSETLLNSKKLEIPKDILISAVAGGNLEIVSIILKISTVDINYDDSSALKLAIAERKHDIVKVILEHPDAYLDENITSDDPDIAVTIKNYFLSVNEGKNEFIGQLDPIFFEPIPEQNLIFWKENGVVQYFNEDSLSQHIAINEPINPLTRQKIPERIIRKMSTTVTVNTNATVKLISVPKKITIGLLVLKMWKLFEVIPHNIDEINFYLNYSGKTQHLLGSGLFEMVSLFDLNPEEKLCSLAPNFCIEASIRKKAQEQIQLGKIVPYLKHCGISWI